MAGSYLAEIKREYAKIMEEEGKHAKGGRIGFERYDYSPIFDGEGFHAEEEPIIEEINDKIRDMVHDLDILNNELATSALMFNNLLEDNKSRIAEIERGILLEEERLRSLNMLCGEDSEFDNVKPLSNEDFGGDYHHDDGVFMASVISQAKADVEIVSVRGNGYEGNKYVYVDGGFLEDTMSTSDHKNMIDGSLVTSYEYSRLTADKNEKIIFPEINLDSVGAECVITIAAKEKIEKIKIVSEERIIIKDALISQDGISFKSFVDKHIDINNIDEKYSRGDYIYGSGILSFSSSKYLRLVLGSHGHATDKIAFQTIEIS